MTNSEFHSRLLDLLDAGYVVLAESERLVHQVQRSYRLKMIESGATGWEAPAIQTLNRWMDSFWTANWPEQWPASTFVRWRILRDCIRSAPPPEPLSSDISMVHLLDESFEQCLRYGIDPGEGEAANGLVEWRRGVWRLFSDALAQSGLFHPAELPAKIVPLLDRSSLLPRKIAFAGFEFAGQWEKRLLKELQTRSGPDGLYCPLPQGDCHPESLVYTDPGQEVAGLMENLLASASQCAPHEIAVIVLDSELYSPIVSNSLEDLLGPPVYGDSAAYNLPPDRNLAGNPLFSAGMLPIALAVGGEMRRDFFALLRSSHYGSFSRWSRGFGLWDRTWRKESIESGIDALLQAVRGIAGEIFPEQGVELGAALAPLLQNGRKPVSHWAGALRRLWNAFQFPVIANELDQIAWEDMEAMLSQFERDFSDSPVSASEFHEIVKATASRTPVQRSGVEDAGIQVLNRLDARGLTFKKIFLPGLVSGALPQPVRSLPLLSSSERKKVLGGTIESQYEFARYLYGNLLAAAEEIVVSRPAMGRDGEVCLPSPFWAAGDEKKVDPVIPWKDPVPAMQRARWVQQSISGIMSAEPDKEALLFPENAFPAEREEDFRTMPLHLAEPVAVSRLKPALLCPALFFFQHVLELEEMEEFEAGIPPSERGQVVHSILATFVSRTIPVLKAGDATFEDLRELLEKTIREKLAPMISRAAWQVELERLVGEPRYPGLLARWLEEEWTRLEAGWSWTAVESGFTSMGLDGCPATLKGRLDRIDTHPELGAICWDYKTGSVPKKKDVREEIVEPQLPAYLLALNRGLIKPLATDSTKSGAGYIELSSPGKMKHHLLFDPAEDSGGELAAWESRVSASLNRILAGDVSPFWLRENQPCRETCAFRTFCGAP